MALFATHIRFARDILRPGQIKDLSIYYSGVVYPDSRYLTGVDRDDTHRMNVPMDPTMPAISDFERGWAAHLVYDQLAGPRLVDLIPWGAMEVGQYNREWQYITAAKVVEDKAIFPKLKGELLTIRAPKPRVGEDQEKLTAYFSILKKLYRIQPSLETYHELWRELGAPSEIVEPTMDFARQIEADHQQKNRVLRVYSDVLAQFQLESSVLY